MVFQKYRIPMVRSASGVPVPFRFPARARALLQLTSSPPSHLPPPSQLLHTLSSEDSGEKVGEGGFGAVYSVTGRTDADGPGGPRLPEGDLVLKVMRNSKKEFIERESAFPRALPDHPAAVTVRSLGSHSSAAQRSAAKGPSMPLRHPF